MPTITLFATTLFLSSFLLFQIQPIIVKVILPHFGGGPAVWGVSMLFFQGLLLLGYGYAHFLTTHCTNRQQTLIHGLVTLVTFTQIPIALNTLPAAIDLAQSPATEILLLLARLIGTPFFLLSATTPLIQAWVGQRQLVQNPYRLYALSNLAAFAALLSYPFLFEPHLTQSSKLRLWALLYGLFAMMTLLCCRSIAWGAKTNTHTADHRQKTVSIPLSQYLYWLCLPATAVIILLSVTNHLSRDLVSIPFLWIMPLSLYLLTYILCFDHPRWYHRGVFIPALPITIITLLYVIEHEISAISVILIFLLALFALCMICHGELYRLKPHPTALTHFYLMIALGGALGSAVVSLLMPLISTTYSELELGMGLLVLMVAVLLAKTDWDQNIRQKRTLMLTGIISLAGLLNIGLLYSALAVDPNVIYQSRNFFGVLTVGYDGDEALYLKNGNSWHGVQYVDPDIQFEALGYYSTAGGLGTAIEMTDTIINARHIGMVGLGVGTVASYLNQNDTLRIYEINPEVVKVAQETFTYLAHSEADIDIVIGDARRSLEQEPSQQFDLLILDAFSSDAIPVHLLTHEAFTTYLRHLKPNGIIALLISSWYFDFEPMLQAMAQSLNLGSVTVQDSGDDGHNWGSRWMLMVRDPSALEHPSAAGLPHNQYHLGEKITPWSDNFSSPFQLLRDNHSHSGL